jgi:hypothetical protein
MKMKEEMVVGDRDVDEGGGEKKITLDHFKVGDN